MATVGRRDEINVLLDSLQRQPSRDFELIIVDQNGNGFLDPIIQRLSRSNISYKHVKSNRRGLSIARNIGLLQAGHEIIGYPDDDCWYEEHVIAEVLDRFRKDSSLDGIAGCWCEADGYRIREHTLSRDRWRRFRGGISGFSSCLFFKRGQVEVVGGFDESLGVPQWFGSSEETDLIIRCLDRGARIMYVPDVRVHHPIASIREGNLNAMIRRARSYARGTGALYSKHHLATIVIARGILSPIFKSFAPPYSFGRVLGNAVTVWGRLEGMLAWKQGSRRVDRSV